jgi:UDP-2,4-diacetamido-2,4,6-trideoxy-beta-L-altropyranose hydrolase
MYNQHLFFRADGGRDDGLGHIKRCISLYKTIKKNFKFCKPEFIVNKNNTTSIEILKNNDCKYLTVDGKVNTKKEILNLIKILSSYKIKILIIDSKRIDKNYISILKKYSKVVIFEDEKKYNVNPNLVINSNLWAKKLYKDLSPKLLGLKYNTIPSKFFKKKAFNVKSNKILISMGGEDPNNVTLKLLSIIYKLNLSLKFIIILGHSHPNKSSVINFCKKNYINSKIIKSPEDISIYLNNLRLVLSAGGLSAYEFVCARIPQLVTVLDNHQFKIAKMIEEKKCGEILSGSRELNKKKISIKFTNFYNNTIKLKQINNSSKKLIKNSGCDQIIFNILRLCNGN